MATLRKFIFDTELSASAPATNAKQTQTAEELDQMAAKTKADADAQASTRATEALERTIAALTIAVRAALDNSAAQIETLRGEASALALAMAQKIAPAAIKAFPADDVALALRQAMHEAIGEARIILRGAPHVVAALEDRLAIIAQEEGYEGRVMIAADPAMQGADCRIEWRGGGAERSQAAIEAALRDLIDRRFRDCDSGKG